MLYHAESESLGGYFIIESLAPELPFWKSMQLNSLHEIKRTHLQRRLIGPTFLRIVLHSTNWSDLVALCPNNATDMLNPLARSIHSSFHVSLKVSFEHRTSRLALHQSFVQHGSREAQLLPILGFLLTYRYPKTIAF